MHKEPAPEWPLELARGVAALLVVFAHYHEVAGISGAFSRFAYTGVDLFFVLSGYVFARYFDGAPLNARSFYLRRLFRIYPLYFLALCCYILLRMVQEAEIAHVGKHLLLLHTWGSVGTAHFYNAAFWSLPPEVEFYAALPLLATVSRGRGGFTLLLIGAIASHLLLAAHWPLAGSELNWAARLSFHLPGLLIEFLLGVLAYRWACSSRGYRSRSLLVCCSLALWAGLCIVSARAIATGGENALLASPLTRGNMSLFAAISFVPLITAIGKLEAKVPDWLRALAVLAGNWSFGIYLFHTAALTVMGLVIAPRGPWFALACLALTIGFADLAHRLYEAPLRKLGRDLSARLTAGTVAVPAPARLC